MIAIPKEITPELLLSSNDTEDFLGVPFRIRSFLGDAPKRLSNVIKLSVRDRKAVLPLLEETGYETDARNEAKFYDCLLDFLEQSTEKLILLDFKLASKISKNKSNRFPSQRISRHLHRKIEERGNPLNDFSNAETNEIRNTALFDLFLKHLIDSSQLATLNVNEASKESFLVNYEDNSSNFEIEESTDEDYNMNPGGALLRSSEQSDQGIFAILPELQAKWSLACAEINNTVERMGGLMSYAYMAKFRSLAAEMEQICASSDQARDQRSKLRSLTIKALHGLFDSAAEALVWAQIEVTDETTTSMVCELGDRFRTARDHFVKTRKAASEAAEKVGILVSEKKWSEVGDESGRMTDLEAKLTVAQKEVECIIWGLSDALTLRLILGTSNDFVVLKIDERPAEAAHTVERDILNSASDHLPKPVVEEYHGSIEQDGVEDPYAERDDKDSDQNIDARSKDANQPVEAPQKWDPVTEKRTPVYDDDLVEEISENGSPEGADGSARKKELPAVLAEIDKVPVEQASAAVLEVMYVAASSDIAGNVSSFVASGIAGEGMSATISGDLGQVVASLLDRDLVAIAARFAAALEAHDAVPPIGSDVLLTAAASRQSFDAYDSGIQSFTTLLNEATVATSSDPESEEFRNLILFGSLLRPAILMPELQCRQIIADINLRSFGPALTVLQQSIAELDYNFAPKLGELTKASGKPDVSRSDIIRSELAVWQEQAAMRSGPCQPSTYVMNKIVTSGEVGSLVEDISNGKPVSHNRLEEVISRFADRVLVETRANEINRRPGSRSKGNFPQISLKYLHRNILEGVDLLIRYRDVVKGEEFGPNAQIDHLPRHVQALRTKAEAAIRSLSEKDRGGTSSVSEALAGWISRRLGEMNQMLSGQDIFPSSNLIVALGDELDFLPTNCQPMTEGSLRITSAESVAQEDVAELMREHQHVIEAVLADLVMDATTSMEEKIGAGAFSAAERLVARVTDNQGRRRVLLDRIEKTRELRIEALNVEVEDALRKLKDIAKIDLKFQAQITREIDRLKDVSRRIVKWRDPAVAGSAEDALARAPLEVFQFPEIMSSVAALVQEVEAAIKLDQLDRLEQISHDRKGMKAEIDKLKAQIETMSPEMVEDRLALIRDGRPISEIRERKSRAFESFFPGFVEATEQDDWPNGPDAYDAAFLENGGPKRLAVPAERHANSSELMNSWFKLMRQAQSDISKPAALCRFFEAMTFNSPTAQEATKVPGVKNVSIQEVHMRFSSNDFFCSPEFGSKAQGRYKVMVIGSNVLFEQIDDYLEQDEPAFILVKGCMSLDKRQEFSHGLRRRNIQAILIDEALVSFIAVSTSPRLETLFECGLPFGRFEPYTNAAGRLPPEMFFGREIEISLIYRRNVDGCLVYGGRQLGKSALLSHVEERYHNLDRGIIVQRREVNSLGGRAEPASNIWVRMAQMLGDCGLPFSGEFNEESVTRHISEWLKSDSRRRIILLLDETDRFMSSEARNGYPNLIPLKALMETMDRRFKVVFAGLHNVRRMLQQPNSPLAHLGDPICIGPLNATHEDKAAARKLVIEPMRAAGFVFENKMAVENILAYVNDYPSLVQTFCKGLLEFLHRRSDELGSGPMWKIPDSMIFRGEGFDEIRREIRSKFQLTLDLDPRYALIANVLGLIRTEIGEERVLRTGLSPNEIRAEAMKHWPATIQTVDEAGFGVLLDELFYLGVLGRIEVSQNAMHHYVLRTRQVAQMLGQEPDIIQALINIQDLEPEVDYDASSYRRAYRPKGASHRINVIDMKRSPLSDSQMTDLLDTDKTGCRFITGLSVMGLRDVPSAVEQVLDQQISWGKTTDIRVEYVSELKAFRTAIESVKAVRGSERMKLVFIRPEAKQIEALIAFAEKCSQVSSGDVRPVFLLDATIDDLRDLAIRREAMSLIPWGHEMLRAHLQEVEVLNLDSRELRSEILRLHGGIPSRICDAVRECAGAYGKVDFESLAKSADSMDECRYLPEGSLRVALSVIEDVNNPGDYRALLDLLAMEGVSRSADVISDLRVLGLIQWHDPDGGRLHLSAFGNFLQEILKEKRAPLNKTKVSS